MKKVILAGAVIVVLFLVVLYWIPLGIEPLTELYFENHTSLRQNSFPNTNYNFSFSIHNLEYQSMAYDYDITAYDEKNNILSNIKSERVFLKDNETITLLGTYNLAKGFNRAKILVEIQKDDLGITPDYKKKLWWPDPNYPNKIEIHFWTDEVKPIQIIQIPD